jgi:electron transfer flavoprotein beta subunit
LGGVSTGWFMRILVFVKQVIQSEGVVRIDNASREIYTDRSTSFKMNSFDEFAVEEAVLIKEAFPDTTVEAVTVGPPRAATVVKRALGMGADYGTHIETGQEGSQSPFVVASRLAFHASHTPFDLILTGVMAEDDMEGQVGQLIAEFLSIPCATAVVLERISPAEKTVYVEREIEGGYRDMLELPMPAALTIQSGINKPRYPSLSNVLRAKKQGLATVQAESLGQPEPRQESVRLSYPEKSRRGLVLVGTPEQKAAQLLKLLRERSLIPS